MNREIVLRATGIQKRFTKPVPFELLSGVDLSLYSGEKVAIVGKSGEGKTTLLHILATLDQPTSGTVEILGRKDYDICKTRNADIGFVFQSFCLLQDLSCIDNLLMPMAIARHDVSKNSPTYERACHLLEKVGMLEKKDLATRKLSGGQMQRVAIVRAFMRNPQIIFADEPTGNLDHETALDVQKLLFSWVQDEGKSLLLVTHNSELAKQCDRVFLLEEGNLVEI